MREETGEFRIEGDVVLTVSGTFTATTSTGAWSMDDSNLGEVRIIDPKDLEGA